MTPERLRKLLSEVESGRRSIDDAVEALRELPISDVGVAALDTHRELRLGVPEVVFGEGKTVDQIVKIAVELKRSGHALLITRLDQDKATALADSIQGISYDEVGRIAWCGSVSERDGESPDKDTSKVAVCTAGTADLPVAREAFRTLEFLGVHSFEVTDVGVAGIHRLLERAPELSKANVVIVVAGMEGALPSVVGGLMAAPVIAVPSSVGYGASYGGLAALLAMLNSCAAGITVVNIDNGFGAAVAAHAIVRQIEAGSG